VPRGRQLKAVAVIYLQLIITKRITLKTLGSPQFEEVTNFLQIISVIIAMRRGYGRNW